MEPAPPSKFRRWSRRIAAALLAALLVLFAALSFGLTPADARRLRAFDDAVLRWQHDPDFRAVAGEYVRLGADAMRARFCGLSASRVVLGFRSLPRLPRSLAVSSTSESHYEDFSRGELSAYLHLCDEQGVEDFLPAIERLLAVGLDPAGDEPILAFLRSFRMPVPVASDAGAVRSVRAMLSDVAAAAPSPEFTVSTRLARPLRVVAGRIATSLGAPADPHEMTADQQARILERLDAQVRAEDPQLWRTKQVSDLLAGVWAQGYGQIYSAGIVWLFRVRLAARVGLCVVVAATAAAAFFDRGRRSAEKICERSASAAH
jgi:hypothetical protein